MIEYQLVNRCYIITILTLKIITLSLVLKILMQYRNLKKKKFVSYQSRNTSATHSIYRYPSISAGSQTHIDDEREIGKELLRLSFQSWRGEVLEGPDICNALCFY